MEARRYQVFVSSTFLDLQEERAAVVSALLQMEAFPAGMELFPAADDDAWTLIKRVIDSSDYYLLVVGGKYGSIDPETELSFTEKEYDYAVEQGKPVMAFLHADPEKIEVGKSEKKEQAQEKLDALRKKVEARKHVKYWSGPDDLAGKVALSFADFRQTYQAVGWVRGDKETSAEVLSEINELRKKLAKAQAETERGARTAPQEAKGLSQGRELVNFRFVARTRVKRKGDIQGWEGRDVALYLDVDTTWDDLFSCVGPEMLNEADEKTLRGRIENWLRTSHHELAGQEATEYVEEQEAIEVRSVQIKEIEIGDEDFGTLIVQLRALGLIEKSERNRSVKDKGTYWKLTPYGDQHLTTLRAIPKPVHLESGLEDGAQEATASSEKRNGATTVAPIEANPAKRKKSTSAAKKAKSKTSSKSKGK